VTPGTGAADARVVHWQSQLKPGDLFMARSGEDFPVFAEVLEAYQEKRLQHCRFCRCCSEVCLEGGLGDVPASTVVVLRRTPGARRAGRQKRGNLLLFCACFAGV